MISPSLVSSSTREFLPSYSIDVVLFGNMQVLVFVRLFVVGGCVVANLQGCRPTCFLLYLACNFACVVQFTNWWRVVVVIDIGGCANTGRLLAKIVETKCDKK